MSTGANVRRAVWLILVVTQMATGARGGPCPGTGDCCLLNGTPGCDNTTCCDVVCTAEPSCCSIGWSQSCADLAVVLCPDHCAVTGCPGEETCCSIHGAPGCDDADCCETVCDANASCCEITWGTDCVNAARALCATLCNPHPSCPGEGSCCRDTDSPACDDTDCCNTVCAQDSFCCTGEWDRMCAQTAHDICGGGTGGFCFDTWCPDEGGCCEIGGPGCDRAACCRTVCEENDFCCLRFWVDSCIELTESLCVTTVCACEVIADFDGDGATTLFDAAEFQVCFTGAAGGPIGEPCACGDDNGDGDVDLEDYGRFNGLMQGP